MPGEYVEGRYRIDGVQGGIPAIDQENAPRYRGVEQKGMQEYLPTHLQGGSKSPMQKVPEPPARKELRF